jgi:hypothetical protein
MYFEDVSFQREHWLDSTGSGEESAIACCEYDNETSDSERDGEFLYQLSDCYLLSDSGSWS